MAPIRDYDCLSCGAEVMDQLVSADDRSPNCPECGKSDVLQVRLALLGNYTISGNNSASQRPKAGLCRPKKT